MIDNFLSFVAPHYCCGCGNAGALLCDNCKYNIVYEFKNVCLACGKPCGTTGLCNTCRVPYARAWCVGQRRDVLQRLVGLYKFERARSAYRTLGDLLLQTIPEFPSDTIIIPVPTARSHVWERGYDHTVLLARYVAKCRNLRFEQLLTRATSTTQRHASASERNRQAKAAFAVKGEIIKNTPYVLVDDVMTTGATIKYASQALLDAGASQVWVAIVARHA